MKVYLHWARGRGQGRGNLETMCDQLLPLAPKGSANSGQERCVKKAFAEVKNTCLKTNIGQDFIFTGFM